MPGDFSGGVDGFMGLLKGLKKEEILEVFSEVGTEGFCQHCQAVLLSRFRKLIDTSKLTSLSLSLVLD